MLSRIAAVIVFCLMITGSLPVEAEMSADGSRVMVLPFDGTSSGDFQYLTDSIRAMVSSRLAAKEGVVVVDYALTPKELRELNRSDVNMAADGSLFARLNTDYILSGALYTLQTGLKIEVTLIGTKSTSEQEGVFTVLAVNEEHIISSVEDLVDDIAARGLGVQSARAVPLAGMKEEEQEGIAGFSTEHPEKLFKKGLYGGSIVAEGTMKVESLGVRRSSDLPLTIVSMVSGDLDRDGTAEIVAASRSGVEIYRFDETMFRKLAEYRFPKTFKIHAVNIADLDSDGQDEIYVSANNNRNAASAIFSWSSSGGLQPALTGIKWYIRPIEMPGEGWILAGQSGSRDPESGFVGKKIVKLAIAEDFKEVRQEKILPLPANVNVFDFAWANLDGDKDKEFVAIDRREKLLVYDHLNSLIWVSENDYGGSRNFFGPPKSAITSVGDLFGKNGNAQLDRPIIFIPTRLLVADLDKDGTDEIIVGNNKRITPKLFSNLREYDGGSVVCLSWQDAAMQDVWRTNTINGYIADYNLMLAGVASGDTAGQQTTALYIGQVPDKQILGFAYSTDSKLLKYNLNVSGK